MNKLIIAIIIVLIVGGIGIAVYFTTDTNRFPFGDKEKPEGLGDKRLNGSGMQKLTEEQISELQGFFDSNPSNNEIESYCQENRLYCGHYCSQINPTHEYCENMASQKNFNRGSRE
jgi:hypothetical protein